MNEPTHPDLIPLLVDLIDFLKIPIVLILLLMFIKGYFIDSVFSEDYSPDWIDSVLQDGVSVY